MASTNNNNHEKEGYGSPSAATATDQGGSTTHRKRQPPKKSCINCRKSHTACDPGRPCKRCIKTGNEATCCDAPQRKKGRKPLNKAINGHSTSAHSFMQAATVLPSPSFFPSEGRSIEQQQQTILQPQHYHHARHQQQQSRSPQQQHLFSMLLQQQRRPTTLPLPREDPTNRFSDQHTTPLSSSSSSSSVPTPATSATRSTAASASTFGGSSYPNSSDYCSSSSLSSPECIDDTHTNHQTDSGSSRQHPTVATSPRFSYGGVPFSPLNSQRNFLHGRSEEAHAADASSPNSHNITHKRPFHHLNKERNDDEESEDVRSGYQQRSNHHQHQHHHHGLPFSQSQSPGHPHTLPPPLHHHFHPLQHQHQHQQQYSAPSDSKRRKTVASDNGVVEGSFSGFGIGGTGSKVERLVEKAVKRNTKKLRRELKKLRRDNEQIMHQLFTMQSTLVQLTQRLPSPSSAQQQPPPTPQQSPLQRQQQISEQQRPTNGSSSSKRDRSHVEAYSSSSSSSSSAYLYLNEGQLPEDLAYNSSFISSLFASQFGTMSPRPSLSLPPSLPAPSDTNTVDHFRPIPSLQTTDSKVYAFIRFIKPHMQPGIVAISKGWSLLFEYTLNEIHGKTPREVGFIPAEFGHWAFHEFSALMEPPPPGSFTKCYRMRCIFQSKSGKRFEATTTHIILFAAKLGKMVMERAFCIWDDISTSITPSIHHYLVAATERLDRTCHCQQQVGGFCSGRIMTDDSSTSISPPFSFSPAEASSTTSADDDEEAGCSSSGESLGKPDVGGGASCCGGGGPPLSSCSSGQTPAPSSSLCMTTTDAPPSSGCLLPAGPCPTSPQPFDALLSLSPSFYPVVHES
ncbi:Transcriptional regulator of nonfermentable carbon utilization [Balamuthia mandrillaris]